MRNDVCSFNYVNEVHFQEFCSCKQSANTLTIIEKFMVTVIEVARTEMCDGLITEEEVSELADGQMFGITNHSLKRT